MSTDERLIHLGDDWCFGCGTANPHGLGLVFEQCEDVMRARFTLERRHQGAPGIAHGGITAAILDEVSSQAVTAKLGPAATVDMHIKWEGFVPLGRELEAQARVTSVQGRHVHVEASLQRTGSRRIVMAQVVMMLTGQHLVEMVRARHEANAVRQSSLGQESQGA